MTDDEEECGFDPEALEVGSPVEEEDDENEGSVAPPPEEHPAGGSRKSKAAAAKAAKAAGGSANKANKKIKIVDDNGKSKKKIVAGKKWCPPCGKYEPVEIFPPGSGQCAEGRKIMQNMKNASITQGKEEWWEEICRDPKKLVKVVNNYKARCPAPPPGKKRETFNIATY